MTRPNQSNGKAEGRGIWQHFTMREGLPDMKIECIAEDSQGVLWIGTHDRGVVRYDGEEFQSFSRREGLAGNGVFSIVEDRSGHLWFGTDGGLTRFDGQSFETVDSGEPCSFLWGSCLDTEGQVWFGLGRRPGRPPALCRWDGKQLDLVEVTGEGVAAGESIHKVICDEGGTLWVGGERLFRQVDEGCFEVLHVPYLAIRTIHDLLIGDDGNLWVSSENGIWACREEGWEEFFQKNELYYGPAAFLKTPSGLYWIVTYDGRLLSFDGSSSTLVYSLNAVVRGGLCLDRSGRLWVGTYGMGLYCYDATRIKIFGAEQGLPADLVECIAEDEDGVLWLGTQEGLVQYDGQNFIGVDDEKRLGKYQVTGLLVDSRNRLWASTRNANLFVREKGQTELAARVEEMQGYRIDSLVEDGAGRIWFGSPYGKGFGYWEDGGVRYFGPEEGADYPVWIGVLGVDGEGCVWLGSSHPAGWDGLCRFVEGAFEKKEDLSGCSIRALCVGGDGALWIGTNEGLYRLEEKGLSHFSREDGLACEIVTALVEDRDGTLWIGTEGGGVCRYDGSVFQAIRIEGEPAWDVIHAIHQDRKGRIWFCTQGGLIQYTQQVLAPQVEINQVIADKEYGCAEKIRLPSSVERVRFYFKGRCARGASSSLVFRYRLAEYDNEWHQRRSGEAEYTGLRPGSYTFLLQAVDCDLNYSEMIGIKVEITEDPWIQLLDVDPDSVGKNLPEGGGSILIIDGDDAFTSRCRHLLEEKGLTVEIVSTEREAMERLEKGVFDLVLLDVLSCKRGGKRILQKILERTEGIEVITLGDYENLEAAKQLQGMGARSHLTKPFEAFQLLEHIEKALIWVKNPLISYIRPRCGKVQSREEVADWFRLSPKTVSNRLKKATGFSLKRFLLICRIDEARRLLINTELDIQQIADRVGMNHAAFSRAFRRSTGRSPIQFREDSRFPEE